MSPRTFFILNCDDQLKRRAKEWCDKWDEPDKVYFEEAPEDRDQD